MGWGEVAIWLRGHRCAATFRHCRVAPHTAPVSTRCAYDAAPSSCRNSSEPSTRFLSASASAPRILPLAAGWVAQGAKASRLEKRVNDAGNAALASSLTLACSLPQQQPTDQPHPTHPSTHPSRAPARPPAAPPAAAAGSPGRGSRPQSGLSPPAEQGQCSRAEA